MSYDAFVKSLKRNCSWGCARAGLERAAGGKSSTNAPPARRWKNAESIGPGRSPAQAATRCASKIIGPRCGRSIGWSAYLSTARPSTSHQSRRQAGRSVDRLVETPRRPDDNFAAGKAGQAARGKLASRDRWHMRSAPSTALGKEHWRSQCHPDAWSCNEFQGH